MPKGIGPEQMKAAKQAKRQTLLNSSKFHSITPLSCSECMHIMGVDKHSTGHRMLAEMVEDQLVVRSGGPGNYKYTKPQARWNQVKWRKNSNAELGITVSRQFGSPI